jgi:hypothetical protein
LRRAVAAEKLTGELSPQSRASYSFPILAADIRALKTKSDA